MQIYYLHSFGGQSPKWLSVGKTQGMGRAVLPSGSPRGKICFLLFQHLFLFSLAHALSSIFKVSSSHFSLTLLSSVPTTQSSPLLCTVKFLFVSLFYGSIRLRFGPTCISQSNLSILDLYSDLQMHAHNINSHRFQEHTQDTDVLGGIIQSIIRITQIYFIFANL